MSLVTGKKNIYGFKIGIIMLEGEFPRIPGDIGNAWSFPFPVLYKVVNMSPQKVVKDLQEEDITPFLNAAKELEQEGVGAITTSCGFLAMFQKEIARELSIPFFASNLLLIPFAKSILAPEKIVGVMTVNSSSLTDKHFKGVGAENIPKVVYGLEGEEEFTNAIMVNRAYLDIEKCRKEHVKVAEKMLKEHPEVGAIVLECTNMPPFAIDIQRATGLPVFDINTLVNMMQNALCKKNYQGTM